MPGLRRACAKRGPRPAAQTALPNLLCASPAISATLVYAPAAALPKRRARRAGGPAAAARSPLTLAAAPVHYQRSSPLFSWPARRPQPDTMVQPNMEDGSRRCQAVKARAWPAARLPCGRFAGAERPP